MSWNKKQWAAIRLIFLLFLTAIVLGGWLDLTTSANQNDQSQVVRVGFPAQKGLTEVDGNGQYSGYTYEYLQQIAQYTGWEYEFVQVPGDLNESLITMLDMLEKGELDLLGGILYSEEMGDRYDYVGYSYGMVETVLDVLYESTADIAGFELMQTLRVAVLQNASTRKNELMTYCEMNHISPELIYCEKMEDQVRALEEGRADAMLSVSMQPIEGLRTIASFSPRPYYFITTKGNTQLAREMNSAIQSINQTDPYFGSTLYQKYFAPRQEQIYYSADEMEYLSQVNTLKVAIESNRPPLNQLDKDGNQVGIAVDLMHWIEQKTGLGFQFVPVATQRDMIRMLQSNEVDLAVGVPDGHEDGIAVTYPYLSTPYVLVARADIGAHNIEGKRLALAESVYYDIQPGEAVTQMYDTFEQCLDALLAGKADYTYANSYMAQYYINQPKYYNLHSVTVAGGQPYHGSIGLAKPVNRSLLNVLNKALSSISDEEMQEIIYKNTSKPPQITLGYFMKQNPIETLVFVAGTMVIIIALLANSLHHRTKMTRQAQLQLKKHLQVYAIASEVFFEYDYATCILTVWRSEGEEDVRQQLVRTFDLSKEDAREGEWEKVQRALLLETITSGKDGATDIQLQLHVEDDEPHWLRVTSKTVRDQNDHAVCVVGKFANIDNMQREKAKLMKQAQTDGLTRVYNNVTSQEVINERLAALQEGQQGALLVIDIDYFKQINDNWGHMAGDRVLTVLGGILSKSFRDDDIVGRLGGDEFVIYMNHVKGIDALQKKCEALGKAIRAELSDQDKQITASIGAVMVSPKISYYTLYQAADHALYEAKQQGRDRFVIADESSFKN